MRKFSDELIEDREFEIGGELFEWIYPQWEVGAKIFDEELTPAETNGDTPAFSWVEDTQKAIDRVPWFLNPKNESAKRWKALVARKTDAVPRHQIALLYRWLVQVTSNLPTTPPSTPDVGGGDSETGSSEESSSTEATSTA
jgi:hypothetical protein